MFLKIQLASVTKENIQGDLLQLLLYPKREKKEEKLQVFKCLYQWLKPLKKEKEKKLGFKKKKKKAVVLFYLISCLGLGWIINSLNIIMYL